jgi:hypothetical protein
VPRQKTAGTYTDIKRIVSLSSVFGKGCIAAGVRTSAACNPLLTPTIRQIAGPAQMSDGIADCRHQTRTGPPSLHAGHVHPTMPTFTDNKVVSVARKVHGSWLGLGPGMAR